MEQYITAMQTASLQFLVGLYFISNTFRIFSYVPQVIQIARQNDDVKAISLWTWGMWALSNVTTALYAALALAQPDWLLVLLNAGNTIGCLSVMGLVVYKRKMYNSVASDRLEETGHLATSEA